MSENERSEMRCPDCGRVVPTSEVLCPECGNYIDDTELDGLPDELQEYSDSIEEEYQNIGKEEDVKSFRNLHTDAEMADFDDLCENLRGACTELEERHNELKHIYRQRKKLDGALIQDFAGTLYTKHCQKARGIHWLRSILNHLNRGVPVEFIDDWDADYCRRVLGWLGYKQENRAEILSAIEAW